MDRIPPALSRHTSDTDTDLGPQMLRLAGRRTRGTVTWMTGPRALAEHVGPTLHGAAEEAGRPRDAVRVVASLPVSVTDEVDGARARAAEQFAMYGGCPPTSHARPRATPARRTPPSSARRRPLQNGSTSCAARASTSSLGFPSATSPKTAPAPAYSCAHTHPISTADNPEADVDHLTSGQSRSDFDYSLKGQRTQLLTSRYFRSPSH
jgi:hypothetical protein